MAKLACKQRTSNICLPASKNVFDSVPADIQNAEQEMFEKSGGGKTSGSKDRLFKLPHVRENNVGQYRQTLKSVISYFAGLRVRVARCGCESRDAVAGREMRVANREMRLQVARCGCESRDAVAGNSLKDVILFNPIQYGGGGGHYGPPTVFLNISRTT